MKSLPVLLLLTPLLLAGCGQKGELFLPGHAPEAYTDAPLAGQQAESHDGNGAQAGHDRHIPDIY